MLFVAAPEAGIAAFAVSASFNEDTGMYTTVLDDAGERMPNQTGFVAIGAFLNGVPETVGANPGADLAAAFTLFSRGFFGGFSTNSTAGSFASTNTATIPDQLNGQPVYMVFGDRFNLDQSTKVAVVRTISNFDDEDTLQPFPVLFDVWLPDQDLAQQTVYGTAVDPVASPELEAIGLQNTAKSLQLVSGPATANKIVDPMPADDDFRITRITQNEANVVMITWKSEPKRFYAIDFSEDMTDWTPIIPSIESGGSSTTVPDAGSGDRPRGFYRVRLLDAP